MVAEAASRVLLLAAFGPALLWAALVARVTRRRSRGLMAAAFLWGAVVAAPVSERLTARWQLAPVTGAPVVEEAMKVAPLVLLALAGARPLDVVVSGILAGIGFCATENVHYMTLAAVQGGPAGLARTVYLRGFLEGLNHAVFSGAAAAGLGWARVARAPGLRALAPVLGVGAAVGQHALWNGLASGAVTHVLCNAAAGGGSCRDPDAVDLFVLSPLIVAAAVGPGALGLLAAARRLARRNGGPPADRSPQPSR
jgi:RsiW-degrading membrane proteinase PrsW (M82 family)